MKRRIVQDGGRFHDEDQEGILIYCASIVVSDGDIEAAKVARKEFMKYEGLSEDQVEWR